MKFTAFIFFIGIATAFGQPIPGKSLVLQGSGQHVLAGRFFKDARTVSFWIKPQQPINTNNAQELPVIVRDIDGPSSVFYGEAGIFFGKIGTPDAGRLVFFRTLDFDYHSIHSNQNNWSINQWYHVAVVIHPQDGMRMYINGELQQDTNPSTGGFMTELEGPFGNAFIGRWGDMTGFGIAAEIDELRAWNMAQTEADIRSGMCKTIPGNSAGLLQYYNFDFASNIGIPNLVATGITGVPSGMSATNNYPTSNAPVGQTSTYVYGFLPNTQLALGTIPEFVIDSLFSNGIGVHIYNTPSAALNTTGADGQFFGVWFTGSQAAYRAKISYTGLSTCDSCAKMRSRDHQTSPFWIDRGDAPKNCLFTLPAESPGNLSYREEYHLVYKMQIVADLPDTIFHCDGEPVVLSPRNYTDARYLWDDNSTERERTIKDPGTYWVNIKWRECEIDDTVVVVYNPSPRFTLPKDTNICLGDTLVLTSPISDAGASYWWQGGISNGRDYRVFFTQKIIHTVILDNCSWTDTMHVTVLRPTFVNLGKDTTLCQGETYEISLPVGNNFYWSNGHTGRKQTFFNNPGTYWARVYNECFEAFDTVTIAFEDCECHLYFPNAFVPNGNSANQFFGGVSGCLFEKYSLKIFDRWGQQVFSAESLNNHWDGTIGGKTVPQGVYSYVVEYKKFSSNKETIERGHVTVVK